MLSPPRARATAARVALAAVLGAAATLVSWWPLWASAPAAGTVNLAVAVSFGVTAALLWDDPEQRGTARALAALPVFYLMTLWWRWPVEWQRGPLPLLSFLFGYLWFVLGGYALLRYPDSALRTRWERLFFRLLAGWILVGKPLLALITVPENAHFALGRWWPTVVRLDGLYDAGSMVFDVGVLAATIVLVPMAVAKVRRVGRLELLDVLPALIACTLVGLGGGLYLLARIAHLPAVTGDVLRAATAVATLATPIAFLVAVVRRRFARTAAVDFMRTVARAPTPAQMRDEMAATLGDPAVQLWCTTGDGLGGVVHVDPLWRASVPTAGPGRVLLPICARAIELGQADVDATIARRFPGLTHAVLDAAAMALDVRGTLTEVLASRSRLLDAENATREEIGRNLHDGVQPTLAVAKTRLAAARLRLESGRDVDAVEHALDAARGEIDEAITEIRALVRGRFPVLLRTHGLADALQDRTRRMPLPVTLEVTTARLHPDLELNVYYLVAEALTNVVKHSCARSASVTITEESGPLFVRVADDGIGGAARGSGSGLAGMADRAHVLGGTFTIESEDRCGTTITVRLPSGWPSQTTTAPSLAVSPSGSPSSVPSSPASPAMPASSSPLSPRTLPTS